MPRLVIMCGLPRSGKSTLAKQMQSAGYTRVCPDDIRLAMHGQAFAPLAEPYVWAVAETMVRALLASEHRVIVDAVNATRKRREQWVRLAREFDAPLQIILVDTPLAVCKERNAQQEPHVPNEVLERMAAQFEDPTEDEGNVVTVHSH